MFVISRQRILFFAMLLLSSSALFAQIGNISGKWEASGTHEGKLRTWAISFNVKGDTFTGTMQATDSDVVQTINAGKIQGNQISFKVLNASGKQTAGVSGTISGEQMKLTMTSAGNEKETEERQLTAIRKK